LQPGEANPGVFLEWGCLKKATVQVVKRVMTSVVIRFNGGK